MTLSDKRRSWGTINNGRVYPEKDVKEFIKEVIEIVESDYSKAIKVKAIKQKAGDILNG